jgi:RNA-directed DNA polymerase
MANIYLHVLDMYWTERYSQLGTLCRYADDFVIVCRSNKEAERALEMVRWIMGNLKLTLHPTKTHLVDLGREGFEFLGFHFHKRMVWKTGKLLPYFWPGQKAMKAVRSKISADHRVQPEATSNGEDVGELNPVVPGWRNYFLCR